MTTSGFFRYDLRTTDPDAARRFYEDVVGLDFAGAPSSLGVWLLHEQARARGAPPHWLGHVGVPDVDAAATRLVSLGAERLGPLVTAPDGARYQGLRDPLGAVMSVRSNAVRPRPSPVAWHQLHTRDAERAWSIYSELFAWTSTGTLDVPDPPGDCRMFTWDGDGVTFGGVANTALAPGVHTHWLFCFAVTDIDDVLAKLRDNGGDAPAAVLTLPNGARVAAPCHDPQGAAFGLLQSPKR